MQELVKIENDREHLTQGIAALLEKLTAEQLRSVFIFTAKKTIKRISKTYKMNL